MLSYLWILDIKFVLQHVWDIFFRQGKTALEISHFPLFLVYSLKYHRKKEQICTKAKPFAFFFHSSIFCYFLNPSCLSDAFASFLSQPHSNLHQSDFWISQVKLVFFKKKLNLSFWVISGNVLNQNIFHLLKIF